MPNHQPTNAASSGIKLDRKTLKTLKSLMRRSDALGLRYITIWFAGLTFTGYAIWVRLGKSWLWPRCLSMVFLTVPAYAMKHESALGTVFGSRFDIPSGKALSAPVCEELRCYPAKIKGDQLFSELPET